MSKDAPRSVEAPAPSGDMPVSGPRLTMPFGEFVTLMALLSAMTALSIDIMLPVLPEIGATFRVAEPNDRQLVITLYFLGLAAGQLLFGPLSDRLGRRGPLLAGLAVYVLATVALLAAASYPQLLAARTVQGFGAAAARVISVAVVRDLFAGRQMARVMSIIMSVFIIVPVIAPAIGQATVLLGDWSSTFRVLLLAGLVSSLWTLVRLPETRATDGRDLVGLVAAARLTLTTPQTVAYALANTCMFGCLVAYLASSQQVFVDVYSLGALFPVAFGALALAMAAATILNARIVQRLGMRRVSHTALVGFLAASLALLAVAVLGRPPLWLFLALMAAAFFAFGLIVSNANAIALQPLGRVAGMASSLTGFAMTAISAALGWSVGTLFDGTVRPLAAGFAVLATLALLAVLAVEGRNGMFRGE